MCVQGDTWRKELEGWFLARNFLTAKRIRNDAPRPFPFPWWFDYPRGRGAGGAACFLFYARINHAGGQGESRDSPVPFLPCSSIHPVPLRLTTNFSSRPTFAGRLGDRFSRTLSTTFRSNRASLLSSSRCVCFPDHRGNPTKRTKALPKSEPWILPESSRTKECIFWNKEKK